MYPYLDALTEGIRTSAPCELILADDIILFGKTEEEQQAKLINLAERTG